MSVPGSKTSAAAVATSGPSGTRRAAGSARARVSREEVKRLKAMIERLRKARTLRSLGSRELSVAANLSTGTVSALECGHNLRVELLTLMRLAKALEVRLAWLADGTGEMDYETKKAEDGSESGSASDAANTAA